MQITIDASNPPRIEVYLGAEEIVDIVSLSVEVEIAKMPVFKMRQVTRGNTGRIVFQDEKPVLKESEFEFEKLSFVGDWSRLARALGDVL